MLTVDPFLTLLSLMTTPLLAICVHRSQADACARPRDVSARQTARLRRWRPRASAPSGWCRRSRSSGYQSGHFEELSGDSLTAGVEAVRLQARFAPMVDAAGLLSTLIVLWVGATKVADGEMQLGVLLIFLTYVGSLYKPVKALSKLTMIFTKGMAAAERIDDVLSAEPDIKDRRDAIVAPAVQGARFASTRSRSRTGVSRCCGRCRSTSTPARPSPWSGRPAPGSRRSPHSFPG